MARALISYLGWHISKYRCDVSEKHRTFYGGGAAILKEPLPDLPDVSHLAPSAQQAVLRKHQEALWWAKYEDDFEANFRDGFGEDDPDCAEAYAEKYPPAEDYMAPSYSGSSGSSQLIGDRYTIAELLHEVGSRHASYDGRYAPRTVAWEKYEATTGAAGIDSIQLCVRLGTGDSRHAQMGRNHAFTVHTNNKKQGQLWRHVPANGENGVDVWGANAHYHDVDSGVWVHVAPIDSSEYGVGINCYVNFSVAHIMGLLWQGQRNRETGLNVAYAPSRTTSDAASGATPHDRSSVALVQVMDYVQAILTKSGLRVDIRHMSLSRLDLFSDEWLRSDACHLHTILEQLDPFKMDLRRPATARFEGNFNLTFATGTRAFTWYDKALHIRHKGDTLPAIWEFLEQKGWRLWRAELRLFGVQTIREQLHHIQQEAQTSPKKEKPMTLPVVTVEWLLENQKMVLQHFRSWLCGEVLHPERLQPKALDYQRQRANDKLDMRSSLGDGKEKVNQRLTALEHLANRLQGQARKKNCVLCAESLHAALHNVHHDPREFAQLLQVHEKWSKGAISDEVGYLRRIWWYEMLRKPQRLKVYRELIETCDWILPEESPRNRMSANEQILTMIRDCNK